jgi:hypothetical protein
MDIALSVRCFCSVPVEATMPALFGERRACQLFAARAGIEDLASVIFIKSFRNSQS